MHGTASENRLGPPRRSWRTTWTATGIGLLPLALLALRYDFVCDDAFIAFRYSRNLAAGEGLRYNPGTESPVEGFSTLLWVLWGAVAELLKVDIRDWMRITSACCAVALLATVVRFVQTTLRSGGMETIATAVFFGTLPSVALWTTGGLETMAFALAIFGTYVALLGDPSRPRTGAASIGALATVLLRPDGVLWIGMILGIASIRMLRKRSTRGMRPAATVAALTAAAVVGLTAWRLAYFGDWIPNTGRVKAGFSSYRLERGANYVLGYCLTVLSAPIVALAGVLLTERRALVLALESAAVLFGTCVYAMYVGGDFMPMGRLLMPGMPFLAVLFAASFDAFPARRPAWQRGAWTAGLVALSLLPSFDLHPVPAALRRLMPFRFGADVAKTERQVWADMRERTEAWTTIGRALALHTVPGESIVLGPIGAMGYYSGLQVYDTYGLTDREVAASARVLERAPAGHDKRVSPAHFFDREPTYLGAVVCDARSDLDEALGDWWRTAAWRHMVEVESIPLDPANGFAPGEELHLLRMKSWDAITRITAPLVEAARGIDLADLDAALAELERRLPPDGEEGRSLACRLLAHLELAGEERLPGNVLRYMKVANPTEDSAGFLVGSTLQRGPGIRQRHPLGSIHFCVPVDGRPTFLGTRRGWTVVPPGAAVDPSVSGGTMLIVSLVPEGSIELDVLARDSD